MVHLEARVLLKAVSRIAHAGPGRDCRVLVLGDNMGVVLAAGRFRARDYKLLAILRRIASFCLMRNLRLSV
eukprot:3655998-Lingulodinium_polyedra.AAC.1